MTSLEGAYFSSRQKDRAIMLYELGERERMMSQELHA